MVIMKNLIDVLEERGFIDAISSDDIRERLKNPVKVYCGFDPTADSLHLGNMVAMMGLAWFQRYGHTPVIILGGATGMIGDPSGKSTERQFLDESTLSTNLEGIRKNFNQVLDFANAATMPILLNNLDWYRGVDFIRFLREIGKLFRMGPMLGKESVKKRIQSEEGMSYTEFSYQVLQGYDFLHLYEKHQVCVQLGGSDQWGNMTAGTDLIRKVHGQAAYAVTFPLLTKSDGQKFGKSEKGAIWLSPQKLSPYEFYQYLIRTEDADVIKLMRMLTFMEMDEIRRYEKQMSEPDYVPRTAQKRLAEELTAFVHGQEGLKVALQVTGSISPGSETKLDVSILEQLAGDMPNFATDKSKVLDQKLIDLLVETGLQSSKGDAKRSIQGGGVYLNNQKISDIAKTIEESDLIGHRFILLSLGKKNKILVRLREDENPC